MSVTQFISKVERPKNYALGSTSGDSVPGPGTYEHSEGTKSNLPGFASFAGGTSKRPMMGDAHREGPAPGAYELEQSILPMSSSTASAFRSKAKRFDDVPESMGPGPGSYVYRSTLNDKKNFNKGKLRLKSGSNEIMSLLNDVSVCTRAPSIPARNQSYGYELGESGNMVLQEAVGGGCKGTKGDTVGPGTYDPKYTQKNRSTAGFTYAQRPVLNSVPQQSTPGPGTYNSLSSFDFSSGNYKTDFVVRLNEVRNRQSAAFESKSIRDPFGDEIKRNCAPGQDNMKPMKVQ
eukprot:CAMPEP_0119041194 /NCGR_PEP_ID=MMETSP1177-20130426/11383_1 /TAXON_ID=2985 /ORGANISM="Ochromonas sp, Strain CCMP1899" /LENGTH=289 /DNA_ID=CAMNT_0007007043 /DNA_START=200 /DNA_END=1070 /DNA_ORIENTATION=+